MISMKIKNGQRVHALLQQLPVEVETKILRQGVAKVTNIVRDEARRRAPKKSGAMAKAIKTTRNTKRGQVIGKVKMKGKHSFLALFHEYGVAPHLIKVQEDEKPTRRKKTGEVAPLSMGKINRMVTSGSLTIGGNFVGPVVHHPGHAATPFLRPAMDAKAKEVVDEFGKFLATYLQFGSISVPTIAVDEEE